MSTNVQNPALLMQVIQKTPAPQIADLDFVREKYINNYNSCHKEKIGELMYHRNVIHFKQTIAGSQQLAKADPFSLYAAFVTAAANGYSLDPNDNEVYLIARGGKACLDRQAGAYVRRLTRTGQLKFIEQAKLVYEGDMFLVENGRVQKHVESFKTDNIIAAYVKVVLDDDGTDRFFIYRKSDWESWRKKSSNAKTIEKSGQNGSYISESLWDNGIIGGTQPEPNFLRTKIIKHACKEKCWYTGATPAVVETFAEVEIDTEDESFTASAKIYVPQGTQMQALPSAETFTPAPASAPEIAKEIADDSFIQKNQQEQYNTQIFQDDQF